MIANPSNVKVLGDFALDHPEGLCFDSKGNLYCGGEAGQIYLSKSDGPFEQIASTEGFLLGMAVDGHDHLHLCDMKRNEVLRFDPGSNEISVRSSGTPERSLEVPNFPVFDSKGNLYVSSSGDYWDEKGKGCVMVIRPDDSTELFHSGPFGFANGLAIDAREEYLYIVQSSPGNVVRVPLAEAEGEMEIYATLPEHTVPDGLAFNDRGELIISCYRPDIVYIADQQGGVEVLIEDVTAELLMRPTNVALAPGRLIMANLGGWHLSEIEVPYGPQPLQRPKI